MPRPIMPLSSTSHLNSINSIRGTGRIFRLKFWPCSLFSYTWEVEIFCICVRHLAMRGSQINDHMYERWIFTSRFSGYPRYADRFWYNLDKTSLSTNPNPLPGIFIAFIDKIEGEFHMNVHLPCPVWTMTTAPLGIRPCSSSQASRSSSCSTLSKPRACTLFKARMNFGIDKQPKKRLYCSVWIAGSPSLSCQPWHRVLSDVKQGSAPPKMYWAWH